MKELMRNPKRLEEMEKASAGMAKKEAGKKVVNQCYRLVYPDVA